MSKALGLGRPEENDFSHTPWIVKGVTEEDVKLLADQLYLEICDRSISVSNEVQKAVNRVLSYFMQKETRDE